MIAVDREAAHPLQRQIYDAYRTAIVSGSLRSGERIPSTRLLATELGVSRFPVLNAYAQLLAEGYFESRIGAGTVVSSSIPDQFTSSGPVSRTAAASPRSSVSHSSARAPARPLRSTPRPVAHRIPAFRGPEAFPWLGGLGPFGIGQVALDQFPMNVWSNLIARRARKQNVRSFHYGDSRGLLALRETIAAYLRTARSLRCEPDQVMIVSGSQHALELSARVLLDPGSHVWIEDPGYRLARMVFALTGCHLSPVPADAEGLNVAEGIKRCPHARAALVTPSHQFPLGSTMSASRRLQLLDWAQSSGSWIIEDDYDSEYRFKSPPISSLQGLDTNDRVIYIGTFSKVLFPALRLGYLVIPPDLVDHFLAVRRTTDIAPAAFQQEVLNDFMAEGHFARHIRRMRILYGERRRVLKESLNRELGDAIEILGSEAGMHLSVIFKRLKSDVEVAERAARQSLWLWPLSVSYFVKALHQGFILGFGSTSVEEIPRSVRRLRQLLN